MERYITHAAALLNSGDSAELSEVDDMLKSSG